MVRTICKTHRINLDPRCMIAHPREVFCTLTVSSAAEVSNCLHVHLFDSQINIHLFELMLGRHAVHSPPFLPCYECTQGSSRVECELLLTQHVSDRAQRRERQVGRAGAACGLTSCHDWRKRP